MQVSKEINRLRKNKSQPKSFSLPDTRKIFDRETELPKLIGLWPADLRDYSFDGTAKIISFLNKALRIERRRGSQGHWTYDLNRHLALSEALKIEQARLHSLIRTHTPQESGFKSDYDVMREFAKTTD